MWEKNGSIWVYTSMPIITIAPGNGPDGQTIWHACCGGRPVLQISPSTNLGELMMRTVKYYDDRIETETVKERWRT